jgi:hypothetical protein
LWLQQQNLFERLLPARLSRREIARWKVLMDIRAGSLRIDSRKPHNARIGRSVNPALSQLSRARFTFSDGSAFALQSRTIRLWTESTRDPLFRHIIAYNSHRPASRQKQSCRRGQGRGKEAIIAGVRDPCARYPQAREEGDVSQAGAD